MDDIAGLSAEWDIDLTVGTYNQRAASTEATFPLQIGGQPAGGAHIFVDVEDSGSFYRSYAPTSELAQFTFAMGTVTTFEFGVQYQSTDSIQVPGWNRITQELIDEGIYITGTPPRRNDPGNPIGTDRLLPQEVGAVGAAAPAFLNNSFSSVGTFCAPGTTTNHNFTYRGRLLDCPGAPALTPLIAETVGTTILDHRTSFIDEADFVDTQALTAYAELSHAINDRTVWRNELFYDYLDYSKYHSWGFTALYPDAVAVEFRSSISFATQVGPMFSRNIAGISVRTEDLQKYHALFDETFDFRDLSVGPTPDDRLDWAVLDPLRDARIVDVDGVPTLEGTVRRNFDNVEFSRSDNAGLFLLADIVDGPFNLLLGARYDLFHVEAEDAGRTLLGMPFDDVGMQHGRKGGPSHSFSASYYFEPGVIPYFTAARSNSLVTNQVGGIIPSTVAQGSFLQQSELVEAGVKLSIVSGRVYATLSWYDQDKSLRGDLGRHTGGVGSGIGGRRLSAKGIEFEMRAVLNDRLSLVATGTQTEALEVGDDVFTVINGADFARQNGLEPWQVYGGRIAGLRSTFIGPGVEVERAGLPDRMFSFYATWSQPVYDGRFALTGGVLWASETHADAFEVIELPSYAVSTGSLSYDRNRLRLLVQVNNLFDEQYYTSSDLFEAIVVKPSEGRTVSLTIGWSLGQASQ